MRSVRLSHFATNSVFDLTLDLEGVLNVPSVWCASLRIIFLKMLHSWSRFVAAFALPDHMNRKLRYLDWISVATAFEVAAAVSSFRLE